MSISYLFIHRLHLYRKMLLDNNLYHFGSFGIRRMSCVRETIVCTLQLRGKNNMTSYILKVVSNIFKCEYHMVTTDTLLQNADRGHQYPIASIVKADTTLPTEDAMPDVPSGKRMHNLLWIGMKRIVSCPTYKSQ